MGRFTRFIEFMNRSQMHAMMHAPLEPHDDDRVGLARATARVGACLSEDGGASWCLRLQAAQPHRGEFCTELLGCAEQRCRQSAARSTSLAGRHAATTPSVCRPAVLNPSARRTVAESICRRNRFRSGSLGQTSVARSYRQQPGAFASNAVKVGQPLEQRVDGNATVSYCWQPACAVQDIRI